VRLRKQADLNRGLPTRGDSHRKGRRKTGSLLTIPYGIWQDRRKSSWLHLTKQQESVLYEKLMGRCYRLAIYNCDSCDPLVNSCVFFHLRRIRPQSCPTTCQRPIFSRCDCMVTWRSKTKFRASTVSKQNNLTKRH
jgi:hypothetical protein